MRKIIAATMLAVTLSFGGCATVQQAWDVATSTKISPAAMVIARESFNSVEVVATRYLRLKKCSAVSGPVCRDPAATRIIIPTVRNGITARNNMKAFMVAHPGELGPAGVYDALNLATDGLKTVFAQYKIGVPQ